MTDTGSGTAATSAAERWRYLFARQAEQSAQLRAARDRHPARPAAGPPCTENGEGPDEPVVAVGDPFLDQLRQAVDKGTTVVDAGAGNGRLALALAPDVARVVAVDPDSGALRELAGAANRLGIGNIYPVAGQIESAVVPPCDVAIAAFVLDTLADAAPFLARLDKLASRLVLVCMTVQSTFVPYHPLWSCFHDQPRELGPSHLDAVAIVRQFGADPVVRTILRDRDSQPSGDGDGADYGCVDEAVRHYREMLFLPPTPPVLARLREILPDWLVRGQVGYLDPVPRLPFAVISWMPRKMRHGG